MGESICRNEKVDMLRGIAVILVLAGHGLGLVLNDEGAGGGVCICL